MPIATPPPGPDTSCSIGAVASSGVQVIVTLPAPGNLNSVAR